MELKQSRTRDWEVSRVAVAQRGRLGRLGKVAVVPLSRVQGLSASGTGPADSNAELLASFQEMHAADIAIALNDLPEEQQTRLPRIPNERLRMSSRAAGRLRIAIQSTGVERGRGSEEMEPMMPWMRSPSLRPHLGRTPELMDLRTPPMVADELLCGHGRWRDDLRAIILTPQVTVAEALAHAHPDVSSSLSSLVRGVRPVHPHGTTCCVHSQLLAIRPPPGHELLDPTYQLVRDR